MSRVLLTKLYDEETSLLEELRSSAIFRRYEAVRRLLDLYEAPTPIGAELDMMIVVPDAEAPKLRDMQHILESLGSEMRIGAA